MWVFASALCLGADGGGIAEKVRQAAKDGTIAFKLTTPEEFKELLGPATTEGTEKDGDADVLTLHYGDTQALFVKIRQEGDLFHRPPFTLYRLTIGNEEVDIGQQRLVVLRKDSDLSKCEPFWGFAGVSLANLDLRSRRDLLERMPYDSRTVWPGPDRLPEGFDPARRLAEGKGPGLGVTGLHSQGIDGRGIGIAIIDQPLLRDHEQYASRIVRYEAIDVEGVPVQMHGAPVCSIAVGSTCGVAPKASVYYYANPPWKWRDDKPWAELLEKIIESNKVLAGDQPKIRVVSISLGAFSERPNFERWKAAVAKASDNGVLVVTCDPTFLRLGTLRRDPAKDPNDPSSYKAGRYFAPGAALCVPAGNRTTASHYGKDVYTYYIEGGMSWTVPYLAGLAALGFQVNPDIKPAEVVELWTTTATKTGVGPVVNPAKFIEAVRSRGKR
jgi:subtilisin family serine protease